MIKNSEGIEQYKQIIEQIKKGLDASKGKLKEHRETAAKAAAPEAPAQPAAPAVPAPQPIMPPAIPIAPAYGYVATPQGFIPMQPAPVQPAHPTQSLQPPQQNGAQSGQDRTPIFKAPTAPPILSTVRKDYETTLLLMRWIEFLFEKVKRDRVTLLLDYYKDIGWISEEVKAQIMSYARGEIQDPTKYDEDELQTSHAGRIGDDYKKEHDWKMSAEDHLKSLLFIEKIAGRDVNKDAMNSLEQQIVAFKRSLEGYHGV